MTTRLPVVGGDNNSWGDLLNAFLAVGHDASGNALGLFPTADAVGTYGAVGDGSTNDQVAIQAALNAGFKSVMLRPLSYLINGDLIVPSGVRLFSVGGSATLLNAQLRIEGSSGTSTNVTSAMAKGDKVCVVASTSGMSAGDWVRVVSSINCNSNDAGVDQLGGRKADNSFLSEFARIKTVDSATQLTFESGTLWPYPITAGTDSSTRTTSTVIPVTFNERVRIEGIKLTGRSGSNAQVVNVSLARGVRFVDCDVDVNGSACIGTRISYSLDCHIEGGRHIGNSAATTSSENVIVFRSCTDCSAKDGTRIEYGFQGLDVTYAVTDTALWGGPSISCGAKDVAARGQVNDGFTDHPGVYRSFFDNVRSYGAIRGIRIRGRAAKVLRSGFEGHISSGVIGIFVEGGFTAGWVVDGCDVEGFSVGIEWQPDETGSTSRPTTDGTASGRITDNNLNGCATGIEGASPAIANALIHSVQIERNVFRNITTNPIYISSYCNGAEIDDNVIFGVPATKGGVTYEANVKRLRVGRNTILGVDALGFAIKGPSTATFMTDATTFPAGNTEAHLFLSDQVTDAAVAFSGIIRDATAFDTPKAAGWTGFCVPISTVIPADADVERSSVVFYLDGTPNIQAKFKNSAGTVFTKAVT